MVEILIPGKPLMATDQDFGFFQCQFASTRMPQIHAAMLLSVLCSQVAYLLIHWFNQYYWALILCRHSGVAKCSPHLIYVKTEVQRSEPTCPEALGGSPLPGTEMRGETTDEVLPSWSLHSFLFYICVHYMIIHSFSTFISDFKAYKSACKSAGSIEISNVVIMN